jgi:hypothetical protein
MENIKKLTIDCFSSKNEFDNLGHLHYELVKMEDLKKGDTVICLDGISRTVGPSILKHVAFMGTTLCGEPSRFGRVLVKRILFQRGTGKPMRFVTQV